MENFIFREVELSQKLRVPIPKKKRLETLYFCKGKKQNRSLKKNVKPKNGFRFSLCKNLDTVLLSLDILHESRGKNWF